MEKKLSPVHWTVAQHMRFLKEFENTIKGRRGDMEDLLSIVSEELVAIPLFRDCDLRVDSLYRHVINMSNDVSDLVR
jgi:hypothetical protein